MLVGLCSVGTVLSWEWCGSVITVTLELITMGKWRGDFWVFSKEK